MSRVSRGALAMALALTASACGSVGVSPGAGGQSTANAVTPPSSGTALLSWTPVTQNSDGSLLEDLAGYKVFYGTSSSTMNAVVVLSDPGQTSYQVSNLSSGTWYFTVAAYTTSGIDGLRSNICQKTIQ